MASTLATDSRLSARSSTALMDVRTGLGGDAIAAALIENLHYLLGRMPENATRNDWYTALAYTVRDRMMERYVETLESIAHTNTAAKAVAYLSAEFLTGPHLGNGIINLGIWQAVEEALSRVGQNLSNILEQEEEPGLGNGGLGRLAACYMDSLATLQLRAIGLTALANTLAEAGSKSSTKVALLLGGIGGNFRDFRGRREDRELRDRRRFLRRSEHQINQNTPIAAAAAAMAAAVVRPSHITTPRTANFPMIEGRMATAIMAAMTGTTINPFITALQ